MHTKVHLVWQSLNGQRKIKQNKHYAKIELTRSRRTQAILQGMLYSRLFQVKQSMCYFLAYLI